MPRRTGSSVIPESFMSPPDENGPLEYDESEALAEDSEEGLDLGNYDPGEVRESTQTLFQGDSSGAAPTAGVPVSPPIWKGAQLHPSAPQLRVWKDLQGIPHLVGTIASGVSEEEFIEFFIDSMPKPGDAPARFKVRPLDMQGREIGREVALPPIPSENTTLMGARNRLRMAAERANGNNGGNGGGFSNWRQGNGSPYDGLNPIVDIYKTAMAQQQAMLEMERSSVNSERTRLLEERERMAAERTDLAARASMTVEAGLGSVLERESKAHERLMEQQRTLSESSTGLMTNFFTTMSVQQQEAARRERELENARREREALEWQRKIEIEKIENARKLEDERLRAERARQDDERRMQEERDRREREMREYERKMELERARIDREAREREDRLARESKEREDKLNREAKEREDTRRAEHEYRLKQMELSEQREREHAAALRELELKKIEATGKNPETVTGLISTATTVLGLLGLKPADIVTKFLGGGEQGVSPDLLEVGAKTLETLVKTGGDVWKENIRSKKEARIAETAATNGFMPMEPPPQERSTSMVPVNNAPQPMTTTAQGSQPSQQAQDPQAPVTSKLPTNVLKAVRMEVRNLIQEYRERTEDEWFTVTALALQKEGSIIHYIKEMSVRAVLAEGGAEPELINRVLDNLQKSGMMPDDIKLS